MKEAISNDYKKMMALATGGLIIALSGAAAFLGGIFFWIGHRSVQHHRPAHLGHRDGDAGRGRAHQEQHDLVTYRELVAFSKGEPVDRDNPRSQRARRHRVLRGVAYTLAGSSCRRPRRLLRIYVLPRVARSTNVFSISRRHGLLTAYIYN